MPAIDILTSRWLVSFAGVAIIAGLVLPFLGGSYVTISAPCSRVCRSGAKWGATIR